MAVVPQERLAEALRDATPATRTDFLADLYEARGYDVQREAAHLLHLDPGDRLVAVPTGSESTTDRADTIFSPSQASLAADDARVLGVEDLHEMLSYAVDADVARDLLVTHFELDPAEYDQSATTPPSDASQSGTDASQTTAIDRVAAADTLPSTAGSRFDLDGRVVVGVVAVLALAGGVGLVGVLAGVVQDVPDQDRQDELTPVNGTALAEAHHTGEANSTGTEPRSTPSQDVDSLARHSIVAEQRASHPHPPGLNPWGIDDASRMAAAHRTELTNTSYTLRIRYQEFVDGRATGLYSETVRVENGSRYRVAVDSVGDLRTTPRAILGVDAFRDHRGLTIRDVPANADVRREATSSQFLDRAEQYLHWSLSVENSTVRDHRTVANRTTYLLTTEGDPYTGVENASGTAYVTEGGLVTYGRWSYTLPRQPDVRIVFSIATTDVGSTTVAAPGWVNETR